VLLGREAGLVVEQAVEDVRCLAGSRHDDLGVERPVLVGDMGVERDVRLVAVTRVHVGERLAAAAREEVLAVRVGSGAVAPTALSGGARCASIMRPSASA
jgi:hypothetical protein